MTSAGQAAPQLVASPMVRMTRITKRFGATAALSGAELTLYPGEVHALMGENGSGKSTLSKVLAGIHRPDSGTIELAGNSHDFASPLAAMEAGIAMVHQELNLVPALSAGENLFLGRELRTRTGRFNRREVLSRAREMFEQLGIGVDPAALVESLPVATRQMVEIARVLTRPVRVLILDEPTSALGEAEVQVLYRLVRRLRDDRTSILYISHKMPEIFSLADRYTILRDGRTVETGRIAEVTEQHLVRAMVGRQLGDYYPSKDATPLSAPALEILKLSRRAARGDRFLFQDVSFSVAPGEIVGICGLVGAGRTELLETLFGVANGNWSGTICLAGRDVRPLSPAHAVRLGIAMVTEDRGRLGILRGQSILHNTTAANLHRLTRTGFIRRPAERLMFTKHKERLQIKAASERHPIETLSGGNQQKVILARWLMTQPKVLLLDEPTRGIDVGAKAEIYKVLRSLAQQGLAILFVSSELPEVIGLADRILVMSDGRITAEVPASKATEEGLLRAAMANLR